MARKTAPQKEASEDQAKQSPAATDVVSDTITAPDPQLGITSDADGTDTPANAPVTDDQGQTGGGDGSVLPATDPEIETDPDANDRAAIVSGPDADLMVVCHRKEGRRRAGRRWPAGETPIRFDELTDYQLTQLRGDPQFTVFVVEKG